MTKILPLALCFLAVSFQNINEPEVKQMQVQNNTKDNMLTQQEQKDGWVLLFDGKTTNGWHTYGQTSVNSRWKVADETLYLDPSSKDRGDILTSDEFENYHLQLDWKIAKNGNSGVIFNVHDDTAQYKQIWYTGPEMQVLDNAGHPDAKIHKHRAGDLYDLIASSKETVKPFGEWNHAEIKLNKGKLDFYLNGTNVVSTTMWDDNWRALVAASKFKDLPGFAAFKKGHIALQDHGDQVWFKNIKIMKL